MRAEGLVVLLLAAAPAADAEEALPSAAFLEFLGELVEVEGELVGPQDLERIPAAERDVPPARDVEADAGGARPEEDAS